MGPPQIQLSFTLRTSPNCKTVHLVGNWDGYKGQLPLSKDASKAGAWKGTFRFQGKTLSPGQRYWYYYIMDGYHVSHDPAKPSTTEPTTKRQLNILDVPGSESSSSNRPKVSVDTSVAEKRRSSSATVPKGRPISPSRIVSPKPVKPTSAVDNITRNLAHTHIAEPRADSSDSEIDDSESDIDSDAGSDASVPSLTSSRSSRSNSSCGSPALSDDSAGSQCSCNRFGITRKGDRVRLDCGGSRCGYSDGSDCSDSEPDAAATETSYHERATRRQGVVIRGSRG